MTRFASTVWGRFAAAAAARRRACPRRRAGRRRADAKGHSGGGGETGRSRSGKEDRRRVPRLRRRAVAARRSARRQARDLRRRLRRRDLRSQDRRPHHQRRPNSSSRSGYILRTQSRPSARRARPRQGGGRSAPGSPRRRRLTASIPPSLMGIWGMETEFGAFAGGDYGHPRPRQPRLRPLPAATISATS